MSDEASVPSKRVGRKSAVEKSPAESKKRQRNKDVKNFGSGNEDEAAAPKRGRGKPKGLTKKKATPKGKGGRPGLRERPKETKPNISEDDAEVDEQN